MRLINTETLEMHEFLPAYIPRYAILSHRWQEEEVSFKQYTKRHKYSEIQQLKGFAKVEQFCRIARERQMEWAWIDTCCIDSRNSAELSEAINSMWRWYAGAAECYIYLCDVHMQDDCSDVLAQVERSEWFTRGWTLQELIAPRYRVFFSSTWMKLGLIQFGLILPISGEDKESSSSFPHFISRTSKVPLLYLLGRNVSFSSIGERISWSAGRRTSRPEDVAYSLMGLLDVNMPLLYREGEEKAFVRLQMELIKKSPDTSLFAWDSSWSGQKSSTRDNEGLLALSPAKFARFDGDWNQDDDNWRFTLFDTKAFLAPYEMTNRGLYLHVGAYRVQSHAARHRALWCVPLSAKGRALFLEHPLGFDPTKLPVLAKRTSLIGWDALNYNRRVLLEGDGASTSSKGDIDVGQSFVYWVKQQQEEPELCEFYIRQNNV